MRTLRVYRALFVAQLQMLAQYRVQSLLYLLFSIIRPVIFLAAWSAVAATQGGRVGSLEAADFAAYYVGLTLTLHLTASWNQWDFEFEVRHGRLSPKLLRPLHPIHYAVAENVVMKLYSLPVLLPVLALIGWTFGARFDVAWWHLALYLPCMLLAAALRFVFGWLVAASAFWTTRVHAVAVLFDRGSFMIGGQIAPLALLPGPLQALAYALPFGYMLGVPSDLLRGGVTLEQALLLMAVQAAWLVVSLLLLQVVWRAGLRAFTAVGA